MISVCRKVEFRGFRWNATLEKLEEYRVRGRSLHLGQPFPVEMRACAMPIVEVEPRIF